MARVKKEASLTLEERLQAALVLDWDWPYKLPKNWCWVNWGECGNFIAGSGFKNEYQGFTNYDIPFYKVSSLKTANGTGYIYDNTNTIDEEVRKKLKASLIPTNSLLFAKIGEAIRLNRRAINTVPCCVDNNMMAFVPQVCQLKYAFYWSKGIDLYDFTNATTVPAIRKADLEKIPFPLAPLIEQQRIVDRIESLFSKLDEAKEKAQVVVDGFETRKAAILHKAFTGELTAKWREEHGMGMESWRTITFKDVCKKITDGTHHSPVNTANGEYMYITAKNIKETGIDLTNVTFVSKDVHDEIYSRCDVQYGDVLYIKDGATTGIATVNTIKKPFSLLSSVAVLRPDKKQILAEYMAYNLNSSKTKTMMINNMSGNAITRLTLSKIKTASITICSLDEQGEIVCLIDVFLGKEQQAKEAAEAVLDQIDLMKKSILARAFRGELGTNDPSEESAVELLKQVIEQEDGAAVRPKTKAKRISIPTEIKSLLSGTSEEAIVKLLLKAAPESVSIQEVMSISKKKFELIDALRNLEKKQIVLKSDSGEYSLVR